MDPFILSSIFISIAFFVILLFNIKMKSKIIKYSFLILTLVFLITIGVLDTNFVYNFLEAIITYLWYPNYLLFVLNILFSIIILLYTLLNDKMLIIKKIASYIFFCISFSCYITFLRLDIDPTLYSSLYKSSSLTVMRIVSVSAFLWLIINIVLKIRGKNEK